MFVHNLPLFFFGTFNAWFHVIYRRWQWAVIGRAPGLLDWGRCSATMRLQSEADDGILQPRSWGAPSTAVSQHLRTHSVVATKHSGPRWPVAYAHWCTDNVGWLRQTVGCHGHRYCLGNMAASLPPVDPSTLPPVSANPFVLQVRLGGLCWWPRLWFCAESVGSWGQCRFILFWVFCLVVFLELNEVSISVFICFCNSSSNVVFCTVHFFQVHALL